MSAVQLCFALSLSPWVVNEDNQIGIPIQDDPEENRAWIDLEVACDWFDPDELPGGSAYTARLISAAPELRDWIDYARELATRQLVGTESPSRHDWGILKAGTDYLLAMIDGTPILEPCLCGEPKPVGAPCPDPECPCSVSGAPS